MVRQGSEYDWSMPQAKMELMTSDRRPVELIMKYKIGDAAKSFEIDTAEFHTKTHGRSPISITGPCGYTSTRRQT